MKIETKIALNDMKKNKKRAIYITISLILCTVLILTTMIVISSIRNGVSENFDSDYNDYHIILKDLSVERFNKIKTKEYIDEIYIQKSEESHLEKVNSSYEPKENVTVYLKYNNINNVCTYTDYLLGHLDLSELEFKQINNICKFNNKLLTIHGFIDVHITEKNNVPKCLMKVNYSLVIEFMIFAIILIFSVLFIIILYNAFLITINERKKEYAILNSLGGTEGQVLKMVFTEAILLGILTLLLGGMISIVFSKTILYNINNILGRAGYYFKLVFDIKYIMLSIIIIAMNIYIAVLIPSLKASSSSVIQGIRSNKEIKNKKRKTILEKILPIEGKVAIKNIRRNKNKYRFITFLLIVCLTAFISISTYINYEKETANLVSEYDVDAEMQIDTEETLSISKNNKVHDYTSILEKYEEKYNKKIDYFEYRNITSEFFLVEPTEAFIDDDFGFIFENKKKGMQIRIVALDDMMYRKYINTVKCNYGDYILYNNKIILDFNDNSSEPSYSYAPVVKKDIDLKLNLIDGNYKDEKWFYEIIETEIPNRKIVITDKVIEGFQEIKTSEYFCTPTLFIDMDTYNKLNSYIESTYGKFHSYMNDNNPRRIWDNRDNLKIKIKCDDVVEFKNYIEKSIEEQNLGMYVEYYTLENQEKLMYIDIVELILKIIIILIVTIGIVSTINILNASLIERREDFNLLYRMGATKGNVKKILIYECIYMFIKATVISIILSIPIIYMIIKRMEQVLVLNKLLIPFGSIGIFIAVIFVISLVITLYSTKMIKED